MSAKSVAASPKLYLVVPAFNEEQVLLESLCVLESKLTQMIQSNAIAKESALVLVDDGSSDRTWEIAKAHFDERYMRDPALNPPIKSNQPQFLAIKLARNFGHQSALLAGLHYALGKCDCAISIDCDLQQDEEKLIEFVEKFCNGADVVLGVRNDRDTDSMFKKYSALFFYKLMEVFGVKIVKNHADYRLLSHRALKALFQYGESNLFLRAIVLDIGLKQDIVYFDVKPRFAGESKYSLRKMLSFAWSGITSFSIAPLRFVSAVGGALFVLSVLFGFYVLWVKIFTHQAVQGWTSLAVLLCFLSGVQLLSLGIIGEYIGKAYQEIEARPKYIVKEMLRDVDM